MINKFWWVSHWTICGVSQEIQISKILTVWFYTDQTVRKYSRHVIYTYAYGAISFFLSWNHTRLIVAALFFSSVAGKGQTYYMTLFATSQLLSVYSVLYWFMRRQRTPVFVACDQVIGWAIEIPRAINFVCEWLPKTACLSPRKCHLHMW